MILAELAVNYNIGTESTCIYHISVTRDVRTVLFNVHDLNDGHTSIHSSINSALRYIDKRALDRIRFRESVMYSMRVNCQLVFDVVYHHNGVPLEYVQNIVKGVILDWTDREIDRI